MSSRNKAQKQEAKGRAQATSKPEVCCSEFERCTAILWTFKDGYQGWFIEEYIGGPHKYYAVKYCPFCGAKR